MAVAQYRGLSSGPPDRDRVREEVDAELSFHLQMRARELEAGGLDAGAAWLRARREFGDLEETRRYCERLTGRRARRARIREGVDMVREELKYAWRQVWRHPAFAVVAALTLALGIGANTAIFSAVHAVLLRPLPYPEPGELVRVYAVRDGDLWTSSPANYLDWREQNEVFREVAAYAGHTYTVTGADATPERVTGARVAPAFFEVLGVRPLHGRTFVAGDDAPGRDRVVVLAEGLWRRRFGGDPAVIGESMVLDGVRHTVAGVAAGSIAYPASAQLWTPLALSESARANRGAHYLGVLARLRPGVPLERAVLDMRELAARLESAYPDNNTGWTATVVPLHEAVVGDVRTPLLMLLGAVGLVLLIACVNVASLLLARGLGRRRELAIRASLGASRRRLFGSLLGESLLLATLGGATGVALAWVGIRALVAAQADAVPRLADAGLSLPVLGFATGVTVLTGLAFGILPALRSATSPHLTQELKDGGGGSAERAVLRGGLVVAEIALAVVLLGGAGLLLRSFLDLTRVDPGFRTEGLLTFALSLPSDRYESPEEVEVFYAGLLERLESLPDVERSAATFGLPLTGFDFSITVEELDGRAMAGAGGEKPSLQIRVVTADYFETMDIPVVHGRRFTEQDRHGTPQVAMVNETAARLLWPESRPVGRDLRVGTALGLERGRLGGEVVGVVRDFKHFGLAAPAPPEVYVVHRQFPDDDMSVVLRTGRDPAELVPSVRAALRELDPGLAMDRVRTMDSILAGSVARRRFYATLLGLFGAGALVLAAVGVYGLMAFTVRQRTREIGIRMALGASARDVLVLVLGRAALLAGLGAAIGVGLALVATRPLAELLYRLEPGDPATLAGVVVVLLAVALLAAALPAWRGTRIDPMGTLRTE